MKVAIIFVTILFRLVDGKVLDKSENSCDLHRMRVCMKQFMTHTFPENQVCSAVKTNIDCFKLAGCCDEYIKSECLDVIDKISVYRDMYLHFDGCSFPVCDCGCQTPECQAEFKRESVGKNHHSTTSGLVATVFLVCFFAVLIALL